MPLGLEAKALIGVLGAAALIAGYHNLPIVGPGPRIKARDIQIAKLEAQIKPLQDAVKERDDAIAKLSIQESVDYTEIARLCTPGATYQAGFRAGRGSCGSDPASAGPSDPAQPSGGVRDYRQERAASAFRSSAVP